MINYHLIISGQVQGVGFRWGCYQLAQRIGISGFVKNLANGQVYLEVQGKPAAVARFVAQVKSGPTPYARVDHIAKRPAPCQNYGENFTIRR